jgi:hypothetical protein
MCSLQLASLQLVSLCSVEMSEHISPPFSLFQTLFMFIYCQAQPCGSVFLFAMKSSCTRQGSTLFCKGLLNQEPISLAGVMKHGVLYEGLSNMMASPCHSSGFVGAMLVKLAIVVRRASSCR